MQVKKTFKKHTKYVSVSQGDTHTKFTWQNLTISRNISNMFKITNNDDDRNNVNKAINSTRY